MRRAVLTRSGPPGARRQGVGARAGRGTEAGHGHSSRWPGCSAHRRELTTNGDGGGSRTGAGNGPTSATRAPACSNRPVLMGRIIVSHRCPTRAGPGAKGEAPAPTRVLVQPTENRSRRDRRVGRFPPRTQRPWTGTAIGRPGAGGESEPGGLGHGARGTVEAGPSQPTCRHPKRFPAFRQPFSPSASSNRVGAWKTGGA